MTFRDCRLSVVFAILMLFASNGPSAALAVTWHVSPRGSDKSSGTAEEPFATLGRAQQALHELRRVPKQTDQACDVIVHGGTYRLTQPLVFTAEDSGTEKNPVVISAAPGEAPVFSGGRQIEGWREVDVAGRRLWAAQIPEVAAGKWYFHQLFINGQRRTRARHPNVGFSKVADLLDPKNPDHHKGGQNRFRYLPGDIVPCENPEDLDVVMFHLWVDVRMAVATIDDREHTATFVKPSRRTLEDGAKPARYYLENGLELLDSPGEWYLNRKTGLLYYWPVAGENMTSAEVIAPVLTTLVRFDGNPELAKNVNDLTLRGLTFSHAEWWLARDNPGDIQAAQSVPGAVVGSGMTRCTLDGCTVSHVSNYGIQLAKGCQQCRIAGCELRDLGAGGVKIGETIISTQQPLQTFGNTISDCHIHDGGQTFHQAVGIWVGQSTYNTIAHNHIHDFYYTGISLGWTWGYGPAMCDHNTVEFNHVHDLGKEWLSDMGGIYTLGKQTGTVIRNNVFHDIAGQAYGGWGIYFDEGSAGILAENNLVYRTTHGGFHQHYGQENIVRNNIFALGRDQQIQRTKLEEHPSFTFERNIVYFAGGKLLHGQWEKPRVAFDHNLYWRTDGREIRFDKLSLKQWQKEHQDEHSRIADPLFVNAPAGDFRLDPHSPALELGFVPFDIATVGPRK